MQIDDDTALVLDALVPNAAFDGWTSKSLRMALQAVGRDPEEAGLLFAGNGDMIEAYFALGDARMVEAAKGLSQERLTARVRAIIALRLEQMSGDKEAIRRALTWLLLPRNAPRLTRITAVTADSVWFAAGDKAADFSWYTKRATLGAVLVATLLYWLSDTSPDSEKTLAFLDRRLSGVGRITKLRHQLTGRFGRLKPGFAAG